MVSKFRKVSKVNILTQVCCWFCYSLCL